MINSNFYSFEKINKAARFLLVCLSIFVLSIASFSAITGNVLKTSDVYAASTSGVTNYVWTDNGGRSEVQINTVSESLDQSGHYTTVFSFRKGPNNTNSGDLNILVGFERDRCPEPNGQVVSKSVRYPGSGNLVLGCYTPWEDDQVTNISLNASNNYNQTVSVTTTQLGGVSCGTFQNDLWVLSLNGEENFNFGDTQRGMGMNSVSNDPAKKRSTGYQFSANGKTYPNASLMSAWSWMGTGKDLASCQATPTPTPTPTPSRTPSPAPTVTPKPSASPSTVQCPIGKVAKVVDSTIICVAQNQTQTQTQTQNNNQNQTVNQNVNAPGGSSSSSSSSSSSVNLTVNNPTPAPTTTTIVLASNTSTYQSQPQVVTQTKGDIKELPKTGLPLAALALGGLMPAGFGIKRFSKKSVSDASANSIWTEKQLNS